jgi:hypothetical protein
MISLDCGTGNYIELKNPIFGDKRKYDNHRIVSKSIYGYNTLARNAETPEFISLSFEFETMSQYPEFVEFITNCIGKKITLTTHDNIEYEGTIVGPYVYSVKRDGFKTVENNQVPCTLNWSFTFEVESLT